MKCFLWLSLVAAIGADDGRTPTYSNADLSRVAHRRHETGGGNSPAVSRDASEPVERPDRSADRRRWEAEAARVRRRVLKLEDRIAKLESGIQARRRNPRVLPYSDEKILAWEREARTLRRRADEEWRRLRDRARRARVPPGWLR